MPFETNPIDGEPVFYEDEAQADPSSSSEASSIRSNWFAGRRSFVRGQTSCISPRTDRGGPLEARR
jgi:hypothetical protein